MTDLRLFKALGGGAFDHLNCQHNGEFEQKFSSKPKVQRGRGEQAVLELTGIKSTGAFFQLERFFRLCPFCLSRSHILNE